ncbi:hypothetical protein ACH4YO_06410 [Streptomyces noursei]|uniref:hypothetical protein n=1 Tax=Streptomyces noursei TaxID=1971 RepID=UPI0033DCD4C4
MNPMDTVRLLPWNSPEGKPCYLLGGTGTGYVSRLADRVEAEHMDAAAEFIEEAGDILAGRCWTPGEIHLLAVELTAHLARVHRVSESRGVRLLQLAGGLDEDDEGGVGETGDEAVGSVSGAALKGAAQGRSAW